MPQAKTPQGPVASGTHCWLESGAVKWEREQEGRMGNEERRTKSAENYNRQGQSMKHTRRMVRREGVKKKKIKHKGRK